MFKFILLKTEYGVDTNRIHIRNVQETWILKHVRHMWIDYILFYFFPLILIMLLMCIEKETNLKLVEKIFF